MKSTKLTKLLIGLIVAMPLSVWGDSATDRQIEKAAKSSYNYRAILKEDGVDISVRDGVVTLSGEVPDRDRRTLAEDTVSNLPGVVRVDNRIAVDAPATERSDKWIGVKIRTRLALKSEVSARDTDVHVQDGVVTLTGVAGSAAQKALTEAYAKEVEGVKSVRNQITVDETRARADRVAERRIGDDSAARDRDPADRAPVSDRRYDRPAADRDARITDGDARTTGEVIDDASLTAQIKYALLTNRSTSAVKTKVTTIEGVATITGVANSRAEKDLVTQLAQNVRGVRSVRNEMTVP